MGPGDKSTSKWADNRQTMPREHDLALGASFAFSARRSVSEGGFEPPRPIRPLGPRPRLAHGSAELPRARASASSTPRRASGRLPGAELLHVLKLPDFERADRIG